ncbi:PepSY-associated TM helix domain-containing protein [Maribacter sp. MAR_2009_72]|uniref:PepSY-associated TM helix domain-containing protein n=1 Tax=Maribacter sp. MAR_2009_72 TaxID=1250050 RepID=UPI00119BA5CD|nr:PepSY-associated TM helix domain-containing protein [Maribacter sp. MAR_2009_72]TVZ14061.1 putative iron-regulated membrane protein [Maribacter sp. MAR_2009_72]
MSIRKFILQLHKILGLVTGVVVFIVAITGCCWSFREEIESFYDGYKKVMPQELPMLTPSKARDIAMKVLPGHHVHGTLYQQGDDAIEVIFYDLEPEFYQSVFLDPYTGKVIKVVDHFSGFFAFILDGHMHLWLPKKIGAQVVGISILVFMVIIISGIFLWLPKKQKNLKQRLTLDWKQTTRWKRKNFDLHTVIGFYICSLALLLAFTGTIMSYTWFHYAVYKSIGGQKDVEFIIPANKSSGQKLGNILPMDVLVTKLRQESPDAKSIELHYPATENESIYVEISNSDGLYYNADYRFFDQHTLEEIETSSLYGKYENAKAADKLLRMNYDIHIGAIGGLAGKTIAFLISLLTATLPVTGAFLWYGRHYKKRSTNT